MYRIRTAICIFLFIQSQTPAETSENRRKSLDSAGLFMLEVYHRTSHKSGEMTTSGASSQAEPQFDISSSEIKLADESDTMVSVTSKESPSELGRPYEATQLLRLNVENVPRSERDLTAYLRLYHNLEISVAKQPFTINVQQVIKENGVPSLKLLQQLKVTADHSGWLMVDVTEAVDDWSAKRADNFGLHIQVLANDGSEITMTEVGLVDSNGNKAHIPFLTVYVTQLNRASNSDDTFPSLHSLLATARSRRTRRRTKRGTSATRSSALKHINRGCQPHDLTIRLADLWSFTVIAPVSVNIRVCSGTCTFPHYLGLTTSFHSQMQALVHGKNPDQVPELNCVPTKHQAMSMLYEDGGAVSLKRIKDAIALDCGCL